tara:strand:+ start:225 stop:878 length:654 start_codon:yes stop_codon:yes gene_type:complete
MSISKKRLRKIIRETWNEVSLDKEPAGEVYGHGGSAGMAKSQLFQIATEAAELHDMLGEDDELPEWVQSKIAVMADSMDAVFDHIEYKHRSQLGGEEIDMDDFVEVQYVAERKKQSRLRRIIKEAILSEGETNRYTGNDEEDAGYAVNVIVNYDDDWNADIAWAGFDSLGNKAFEGSDTRLNVPNLEKMMDKYREEDPVMRSAILDAVRKVKEGEYY